jgi:hypothetical protein
MTTKSSIRYFRGLNKYKNDIGFLRRTTTLEYLVSRGRVGSLDSYLRHKIWLATLIYITPQLRLIERAIQENLNECT